MYLPDGEVISLNHLKSIKAIAGIDWSLLYTLDYNPLDQASFETKNATMTFEVDG